MISTTSSSIHSFFNLGDANADIAALKTSLANGMQPGDGALTLAFLSKDIELIDLTIAQGGSADDKTLAAACLTDNIVNVYKALGKGAKTIPDIDNFTQNKEIKELLSSDPRLSKPLSIIKAATGAYTCQIIKEVVIDKLLLPEHENMFLASPHFQELMYHGLLRISKCNGERYSQHYRFSENEVYQVVHPETEGDHKSTYQMVKLRSSPDISECVSKLITPGGRSAVSDALIGFTYLKNERKIVMKYDCIPLHATVVNVASVLFEHILLRAKRLANNPVETINDVKLIGDLHFNMIDNDRNTNQSRLPYGVQTELKLQKSFSQVKEVLSKAELLKNIFPDAAIVSCSQEKIQVGDRIKVNLKNISAAGSIIIEELIFKVAQNDQHLVLVSNTGVTHFHQISLEIALKKGGNENESILQIGIYYNASNIVSVVKGVMGIVGLFSDKAPDLGVVMYLRARNLLESVIRLLNHYISK